MTLNECIEARNNPQTLVPVMLVKLSKLNHVVDNQYICTDQTINVRLPVGTNIIKVSPVGKLKYHKKCVKVDFAQFYDPQQLAKIMSQRVYVSTNNELYAVVDVLKNETIKMTLAEIKKAGL